MLTPTFSHQRRRRAFPIGLHVQDGEIVVSPNGRPAIGVTGDGSVVIGMPEMTGVVWRDELPEHLTSDAGGIVTSGMEELWLRAEINQVNRPPNGLGLVLYTPRLGRRHRRYKASSSRCGASVVVLPADGRIQVSWRK